MTQRKQPKTARPMRGKVPLIIILALYLGLALSYSLTVPVFEAPDEPSHFLYAQRLAEGKGLPVLDSIDQGGEDHQPPLYYWLVAGLLRWFDTSDYEQYTTPNPHAAVSDVSTFGNKNAFVHDPTREGWPLRGTSLAVHMARLVSIILGAATVCATYGIGLKLFSPRPRESPVTSARWMAAAAAGVVVFNPQFLFISGVLNNDNSVIALCSLSLWAAVEYYDRPRSVGWLIALGALSGLTILTKASGIAIVPLVLGAVLARGIRQGQFKPLWLDLGIVILLTTLIGGWWYLRNAILYADPLLSTFISQKFGSSKVPNTAIEILRRFEQGEISFWGTFGWLNIVWDEWIYTALRAWTRLSGLGLLVLAIRWLISRRAKVAIAPLIAALAWVTLVGGALVQWIRIAGGLQGRLLMPAIAALAVLLIAGWTSLVPRRWRLAMAAIPIGGLALLAILTPFTIIAPVYARPPILESSNLPPQVIPVDLSYAERARLIGYQVSPSVVQPGGRVDVTLYWQALEPVPGDFSLFVHLFGREREPIGRIDTYPGLGNFPTSQWEPEQVIEDVYPIRIKGNASAPTLVTISVGWYNFHLSREGIPAVDSGGQPTTTVGNFKLVPRTWPDYQPTHPLDANFGDVITLKGYDVQPGEEQLTITLYWRCDTSPGDDYTVFAHLVDNDGSVVAQMDRPPLQGDYPTSVWEPGELIQDQLAIPLVSTTQRADQYHLQVGLYRSEDGMRLPLLDETGQRTADSITLALQ